jgi:hypothetical protein
MSFVSTVVIERVDYQGDDRREKTAEVMPCRLELLFMREPFHFAAA